MVKVGGRMSNESNAAANSESVTGKIAARFKRKGVIAVGAAVLLAVAGVAYIVSPARSVTTDDAYLQADSSTIAPKVRGLVSEVLVKDNQPVKRGEPLVRIDAEEFDAKAASARADLQNAEAAVAAADAALVSLSAEEQLAVSNIRAAESSLNSANAQRDRAASDRQRYENLLHTGAVSQRDVDTFKATAISAQADVERNTAILDVNRHQATVTNAKRQTLRANLAQAQAAVARARAALNLAIQDQTHSLIVAPVDGIVADRQVQQGDYVQPGSRLMTVVPLHTLYVVANFKETQTARMQVNQPVSIEVDALPGVELKGLVESFAPGSGSQFSLLPFEPGTGNFTKIVQRIPVRIRFLDGQSDMTALRPGLSTTVTVRLARQTQEVRLASRMN